MGSFLLLDYNSWLCFISILQFCCFLYCHDYFDMCTGACCKEAGPMSVRWASGHLQRHLWDHSCTTTRILWHLWAQSVENVSLIFAVFGKCMFMEWLEDAYWDSYLLNLHGSSITTPQDARKRLVLQVAEWLTASLYQERSQTWVDHRYITSFKKINESAAMYSLLSARKRSP